MIFASFSPGGLFLAAGSADHHVRVYLMSDEGPKRILETEAHSDTVDSIQWAHTGLRFISGSKDGSAHVWHFESQQWKSLRLQMSERLPSCPPPVDENKKLKVTMVGWDLTGKLVVTAVNDFTVSNFGCHILGFTIPIKSMAFLSFTDQSVACWHGEIASRDAWTHRRIVCVGITSEGSAHNAVSRSRRQTVHLGHHGRRFAGQFLKRHSGSRPWRRLRCQMVTGWHDDCRNRFTRPYSDVRFWFRPRTTENTAHRTIFPHRLPATDPWQQSLRDGWTNANGSAFDAAAIFGRHRRQSISAGLSTFGAWSRELHCRSIGAEHHRWTGRCGGRWATPITGK